MTFYTIANFGYSYFNDKNITYLYPEFGLFLAENGFGKFNLKYRRFFSSNDYKYEYLFDINQTFFISKSWNLNINYQNIKSAVEGEFDNFTLALNYQF